MAQIRDLDNEQTNEDMQKRAYEIYVRHNGEAGHELEDWLIAEQQLGVAGMACAVRHGAPERERKLAPGHGA